MSEQSNARDGHWQMQRSGVCSPHSADRDRGTPLPRPPGGVPPPSWSRNVNGAAAALSSVPLRCSQRLFLAGRKEGRKYHAHMHFFAFAQNLAGARL